MLFPRWTLPRSRPGNYFTRPRSFVSPLHRTEAYSSPFNDLIRINPRDLGQWTGQNLLHSQSAIFQSQVFVLRSFFCDGPPSDRVIPLLGRGKLVRQPRTNESNFASLIGRPVVNYEHGNFPRYPGRSPKIYAKTRLPSRIFPFIFISFLSAFTAVGNKTQTLSKRGFIIPFVPRNNERGESRRRDERNNPWLETTLLILYQDCASSVKSTVREERN